MAFEWPMANVELYGGAMDKNDARTKSTKVILFYASQSLS
jgi:hypothetical protein